MSITSNKFTKELTLDIYSADLQVITAQQGDKKSRFVKINILANGEPMEFVSGLSATLEGHRADGQVICDDCKIENNAILIELTDAILAVYGDCEFKIAFYGTDNSVLSTVPFKVHVMKNPYDENEVIATPIFSALTEALNKVNKALEDTKNMLDRAENIIEDANEIIDENNILKNELQKEIANAKDAITKVDDKLNSVDDKLKDVDVAIKNANNAAQNANDAADRIDDLLNSGLDSVYVKKEEVGVVNGVASLDENGKVPLEQLPEGIGSGTGIYVQKELPEEIKLNEHWFKIIEDLNFSDYDFLLDDVLRLTVPSTLTITKGETISLNWSVSPSSERDNVTITSSSSDLTISADKTQITVSESTSITSATITFRIGGITKNTTVTIKDKEAIENTYTITYVLDGGTNSENNPSSIKESETVTLSDATKEGYVFKGWYLDSGFVAKVETLSSIRSNIILYAKFEEDTGSFVTINTDETVYVTTDNGDESVYV